MSVVHEITLDPDNQYDVEHAFECAGWEISTRSPRGFTAIRWTADSKPVARVAVNYGDRIVDVLDRYKGTFDRENQDARDCIEDVKREFMAMANLGFINGGSTAGEDWD